MIDLNSIPNTPDQYMHPKWQWKDNHPWATDEDLPDIVRNGITIRERVTAIRMLKGQQIRAELACQVKGYDEIEYLLQGVSDESLLKSIVMDPRSKGVARGSALSRIESIEILAELAEHGPHDVRGRVLSRKLERIKDSDSLLQMANDLSLPMPLRMETALRLTDSPAVLKLIGTDIYESNAMIRRTVNQIKERLENKKKETCT